MLFMAFFSFGWTPMQGLYPTEILAYENRAKGLSLQGLLASAVSLINTWALPPCLAAIGYKTYFIFCGFDVLGFILVYWLVVETKRLTLEDLSSVFNSPEPKKTSLQLAKARRQAAGGTGGSLERAVGAVSHKLNFASP